MDGRADDDKGDLSVADIAELAAGLLFDIGIRGDIVADTFKVGLTVFKLGEMLLCRDAIVTQLLVAKPAGTGGVHKIPGHCQAHNNRESGASTLKRSHTLGSHATRSVPKIQAIQVARVIEPADGHTAIPDRDGGDGCEVNLERPEVLERGIEEHAEQ